MKKKIIISSLPIIIGVALYILVKISLLNNSEDPVLANGWLKFISIIIATSYSCFLFLWLRKEIANTFKFINDAWFINHIDRICNLFETLKESKIIKYIERNDKINSICSVIGILVLIPLSFITIVANICFPIFFEQHMILYIIGICIMFLTIISYLIHHISRSNSNKKSKLSLIIALNWTVLCLTYFSIWYIS